jgi:hypothetical protein
VDAAIEHASQLARAEHIDEEYLSPPRSADQVAQVSPLTPRAQAFVDEMKAALMRVRLGVPRGGGDRRLTDHKLVQAVTDAIDGLDRLGFGQHDPDDVRANCQTISDGLLRLMALRNGTSAFADVVVSEHGVVKPLDGQSDDARQLPAANVSAIGRTLFRDHLLAIELAGTLLLIATIGAIAIAGTRREGRA